MAANRAVPILIGVGDIKNASTKVEDAIEPMQLMLQAIRSALDDTNLSASQLQELQAKIDSIDVVRTWTWPYPDLPGLLAEKLDIKPSHKQYSPHGGNQPARLVDDAARRISLRETKVAIVTGGEALASLSACASSKRLPPPGWCPPEQAVESVFSPSNLDLGTSTIARSVGETYMKLTTTNTDLGAIHKIGAPIHIYPLYENGFRAHRGQSIKENNTESAKLYAEYAKVAERNEIAWGHGKKAESEEVIGTVTKKNRMICFPYPLLMNAFNTVNLASACLLTSTDVANELGIPNDRWIYPLGGAGTSDSNEFWKRPDYHTSPSISKSIDAGLSVSGLTKDQIDLIDLYSCFPIVPKLACTHLGLPTTGSSKPTTLLGGLTSFGGAGNNYSMHAITEMARQLRKGNGQHGLVLANGGMLTYQHVLCLSSQPRRDNLQYPDKPPLPEMVTDIPVPAVEAKAEGEAVIETYTVDFNRDGTPSIGHVVGKLKSNGHRFIANHADAATLKQLASTMKEPIGRPGWVKPDPTNEKRRLFGFNSNSNL